MGVVTPETLPHFRVGSLASVYYVPNYVSEAEEDVLLREICCTKARWTQVSGRRLQNVGGQVTSKGLIPAKLPAWLQALSARLAADTGVYGNGIQPNHVLINAYQPGDGIMAHEDGPAYCADVCILSLGAPAVMQFVRKGEGTGDSPELSVVLMPRGLLIFRDEAYSACLHSIDQFFRKDASQVHEDLLDDSVVNPEAAGLTSGDRLKRSRERVSLTVRRVKRVLNGFRL